MGGSFSSTSFGVASSSGSGPNWLGVKGGAAASIGGIGRGVKGGAAARRALIGGIGVGGCAAALIGGIGPGVKGGAAALIGGIGV